MAVTGKCNCGSVAFELQGKMPAMYKCFCSLCQKQGGVASNASTVVRAENFAWTRGAERITKWKKATGFSSHFCKTCGSPVPNPFRGKYVWVPVGLLESSVNMKVTAYLFLNSKPAWEELAPVEHQFSDGPESAEILVKILEDSA